MALNGYRLIFEQVMHANGSQSTPPRGKLGSVVMIEGVQDCSSTQEWKKNGKALWRHLLAQEAQVLAECLMRLLCCTMSYRECETCGIPQLASVGRVLTDELAVLQDAPSTA